MITDAELGERQRVERLFTEEEKLALRGLMLSNTSFDRVDFSGADLAHAVFRNVSLVGADFRGARLTLATFFCCDMRDTQFDRSTLLRGSRFDFSDLSGARGLPGPGKALIRRAGGIFPVFSLR